MENERQELVEGLAPVSLSNENWEPCFSECIDALAAPSFHSERLSPDMAIIRLYEIKRGLEALLDSSVRIIEEMSGHVKVDGLAPVIDKYIKSLQDAKETFQ